MKDFLVAHCTVGSKINSAKSDAYSVYQVFCCEVVVCGCGCFYALVLLLAWNRKPLLEYWGVCPSEGSRWEGVVMESGPLAGCQK